MSDDPIVQNAALTGENMLLRHEINRLTADLAAIRELMNTYNLGGWTDAVAPMKRALAAEAERDALRADLAEARAEIQTLGKRELDYEELYLEALELLEKMCGLVEWWAPKDGMPRTAGPRAFLARTEGK